MVGRMMSAGREVQEERFVRRHLLTVRNELDGFIRQVFGQVIALLRRLRRIHLVVVVNQVGIVLMRVAPEESVVTLETAAQRPAAIWPGCTGFRCRREMPFPETESRISVFQE